VAFVRLCQSVPTPTEDVHNVEVNKRGIVAEAIRTLNQDLSSLADNGFELSAKILTNLNAVKPTTSPTSPAQAVESLANILAPSGAPKPSLYGAIGEIVASGLTSDTSESIDQSMKRDENSFTNVNRRQPLPAAFPRAGPRDAPYSLKESDLRAAIHIPQTFQYGAPGGPQPIILVPGTGSTGYLTFAGNYIKLLQGSNIADPVWLNIPEFALGKCTSSFLPSLTSCRYSDTN
jgi:hypothetical protein